MTLPINKIICGDCLEVMKDWPDDSVDLIFCSPPYENCRTYNIDFKLKGQAWVDWAMKRYLECVRISRGLVVWVVEGKTEKFRWSATPALLMADMHRLGIKLRKPAAFQRVGIPGSGGPDWLRNDYEFMVCSSKGKLPWSDNTAMGHPLKYETGGRLSNRHRDGRRANQSKYGALDSRRSTPSETARRNGAKGNRGYTKPEIANPGNVIKCKVGGSNRGSPLAHENEAPFPEDLAEFFIRSFCPPDGTVADIFCGSGTTLAVAKRWGRNYIGIDVRPDQCELSGRRINEETEKMGLFEVKK